MYLEKMIRRSWVEIDLIQLEQNLSVYKKSIAENAEIMAVVKADAYGHGDIEVCKRLESIGIKLFAVSNVNEAITLRVAGVKGEILVLGYTPIENTNDLIEHDITQTLVDEKYAELFSKVDNASKIKVQFAIDTGMNRIGLNSDNIAKCETVIRKYANIFNMTGIFTHLCVADSQSYDDISFTKSQIRKFHLITQSIYDLNLKYCHCLNSAGGLFQNCDFDDVNRVIRLGIILYGLKPDYSNKLPEDIKPILSWKSVISMVKKVDVGEDIGYGRSYHVKKEMIVATIPTGYADGYNRLLSNKGYVLINGKKAPIVGRICMDQMMVDITNIDNVSIGATVVLLGKSNSEFLTADDMAEQVNSIGYEIVCNISKRVPRVYLGQ